MPTSKQILETKKKNGDEANTITNENITRFVDNPQVKRRNPSMPTPQDKVVEKNS